MDSRTALFARSPRHRDRVFRRRLRTTHAFDLVNGGRFRGRVRVVRHASETRGSDRDAGTGRRRHGSGTSGGGRGRERHARGAVQSARQLVVRRRRRMRQGVGRHDSLLIGRRAPSIKGESFPRVTRDEPLTVSPLTTMAGAWPAARGWPGTVPCALDCRERPAPTAGPGPCWATP